MDLFLGTSVHSPSSQYFSVVSAAVPLILPATPPSLVYSSRLSTYLPLISRLHQSIYGTHQLQTPMKGSSLTCETFQHASAWLPSTNFTCLQFSWESSSSAPDRGFSLRCFDSWLPVSGRLTVYSLPGVPVLSSFRYQILPAPTKPSATVLLNWLAAAFTQPLNSLHWCPVLCAAIEFTHLLLRNGNVMFHSVNLFWASGNPIDISTTCSFFKQSQCLLEWL